MRKHIFQKILNGRESIMLWSGSQVPLKDRCVEDLFPGVALLGGCGNSKEVESSGRSQMGLKDPGIFLLFCFLARK
jgi:hypothetical protein